MLQPLIEVMPAPRLRSYVTTTRPHDQGLAGSFLQSARPALISLLQSGAFASEEDRQAVGLVLQGKAEGSGEILGVLEQMRDNMKDGLTESMKEEEAALATFGKLEVGRRPARLLTLGIKSQEFS